MTKIQNYIYNKSSNYYDMLPMTNKERSQMNARKYIVRDYQTRYEYICEFEGKYYGLEISINDENHDELFELIEAAL